MPRDARLAMLRKRLRPHDDGGFALMETVVAMVIFVVVATGAVVAAISGVHASDDSRNRVAATNIAQSDLEQARAIPTPAPASYSTSAANNAQRYTVTREITTYTADATATPSDTACPAGGELQIRVTVKWPGGAGHEVRAGTVLAC